MELKLGLSSIPSPLFLLLIVPYGIETKESEVLFAGGTLLIVPYGIETDERIQNSTTESKLLIVPYGIETAILNNDAFHCFPFNRTLWN